MDLIIDLDAYNRILVTESRLSEQLKKIVSIILESKKVIFNIAEIKFETDELVNSDIIKIEGEEIKLTENYLLLYACFLECCGKFNYSLSEDLKSLFLFLVQVREYFNLGTARGVRKFLDGVNLVAIYQHHYSFKPEIVKHLSTWTKEANSPLYIYTRAFSKFLPQNIYEPTYLLELLRRIYELNEYNDNVINFDLNELGEGIRKYVIKNKINGQILFNAILNNYDAVNESISISVIAGLLSEGGEICEKVNKIIENEICQPAFLVALSTIHIDSEIEITCVIDKILSIKTQSKKFLLQLPRFYISIINNKKISGSPLLFTCFQQLSNLICNDDDISSTVLLHARFINGHEKEITNLVLHLINQEGYDDRFSDSISNLLYHLDNTNSFFEILFAHTQKVGFKFNERIFGHNVFEIRKKNESEFDKELIELLIHDQGQIRWMALRLLTTLAFHYGMKQFSFDVLSLSPKKQFKLFTSVLSSILEPHVSLPLILPLSYSPNEFVRESLICRLELLSEDYGKSVVQTLDQIWIEKTNEQREIYERVKLYENDFSNQIKRKSEIKELSPVYTQSAYYNAFMSNYSKVFKRNLNKDINQKSITRYLANTVILAKGGGWQNNNTGEVTQLGKIESSFALPGSYFISPDNFEWSRNLERIQSWENFLKEWEAIL